MTNPYHEKSLSFRAKKADRQTYIRYFNALDGVSARSSFTGKVVVEYHYKDEPVLFDFINQNLSETTVLIRGQSLMTSADFS